MNVLRHIGSRTFQSTLPLRGATPSNAVNNASSDFNPHSPCGERQTDHETDVDEDEFQSTLPLRGATRALSNPLRFRVFQSTLPLRGATYSRTPVQIFLFISIHTPLAGSDGSTAPCVARRKYFNPHSPCGERRVVRSETRRTMMYFNPHSPCGERLGAFEWNNTMFEFQSTLPLRGATRPKSAATYPRHRFQSTLPLRGATAEMRHF